MADAFYYEWLELSAEKFEYDYDALKSRVDEYIKKWNSNKNVNIQSRSIVHGADLKKAISSEDSWKNEYIKYKSFVDKSIRNRIDYYEKNVPKDSVKKIADKVNVSESYVINIITASGKEVGDAGAVKAKTTTHSFTLKMLEPPNKLNLETLQNNIESLGYRDLVEFIKGEVGTELSISSSSKEEFEEAISEIKKNWGEVSEAHKEKSGKKSRIKSVYTNFSSIFSSNDISLYKQYLDYLNVYRTLDETRKELKDLEIDSLEEIKFNTLIDKVFYVVGDREKATSIVEAYCDDKKIGYPVTLAKYAVCPFCSIRFEKAEPVQITCPSCLHSLIVNCPKCGKPKNLISDTSCDGVDIQKYPIMLKKYKVAESAYNRLAIDAANIQIREIEAEWPNIPEVNALKGKIDTITKNYGSSLANIKKHISAKEYFQAKVICESMATSFPGIKSNYAIVYSEIASAESMFKDYQKETNEDVKIGILLEIAGAVSDYKEVAVELKKYPLMSIDAVSAVANIGGNIMVTWQSKNRPNSVNYHVIRKVGSQPANISDGEELIVTQELGYNDNSCKEGVIYYYGVFAERGPLTAPLKVAPKPAVFINKVNGTVMADDGVINVKFEASVGETYVYYSESVLNESNYTSGKLAGNISANGCIIQNVTNGRDYYVALVKILRINSSEVIASLPIIQRVTPFEKIIPPKISKRLGANPGEYVISYDNWDPVSKMEIGFYYAPQVGGITVNSTMNLSDLQKKVTLFNSRKINDREYSVTLNAGEQIVIYPVIIRGSSVIVGNYLELRHIRPISVAAATVSGGRLIMRLSEWPDGAEGVLVCYNFDGGFPQDRTDCDRRLPPVLKSTYDSTQAIEIPNAENKTYFISFFAQRGSEFINVCNCKYSNEVGCVLKYTFSSNLIGSYVTVEMSKPGRRPELVVRTQQGFVPLTISHGQEQAVIPARDNAPLVERISIGKVPKGTQGKLFTTEAGYEVIAQGASLIKK